MFEQIKLRYNFNALEPHIDEETMKVHYSKHHAAYTKNFNDAIKEADITDDSILKVLASINKLDSGTIKTSLVNNGGGYYNHNLYFDIISPEPLDKPTGVLAEKIDIAFGSYEGFVEDITKASMARFGSGWAWLSTNDEGDLRISSSSNQSNPYIESDGKWLPILGIDVWEHAYYLKHKNLRADYIKDFFKVLDWARVEKRYKER